MNGDHITANHAAHNASVNCVRWVSHDDGGRETSYQFISGGVDKQVVLYEYHPATNDVSVYLLVILTRYRYIYNRSSITRLAEVNPSAEILH